MTVAIILAITILLLLSAFFSGGETAITSANRAQLQYEAENGDEKARGVLDFVQNIRMVLGTILVGNNLTNVSATTLAAGLVGTALADNPQLMRWESVINTLIMTPVILIVGELVPKAIGRSHANQFTRIACPPLRLIQKLLYPFIVASSWFGGALARYFGGDKDNRSHITREDLLAVAELATEEGVVEQNAGSMMQTVFELENRTVSSVMVPLVDVVALPVEAKFRDVVDIAESGHTRFPVFEKRIDEIVGILDLRKMLYAMPFEYNAAQTLQELNLREFMDANVLFVPETKPVGQLLQELRYHPMPMAAVVDEHGGVVGIVTMEDLIEEVVGEIQDERDKEMRSVLQIADKLYDCDGKLEIRQLQQELGLELNEDEDFETVGGMLMKMAGKIPTPGQRFKCQGYEIEVLDVVKRRVGRVRFRKL